jgi:chromosome segregation ATPase
MLTTSRKYAEKIVGVEDQINQLRDEKADLESQLVDCNGTIDVLSSDMKKHCHEHDQTTKEKDEALKHMAERKDAHKNQLEKLHAEQAEEQRKFQTITDALQAKKDRITGKLDQTTKDLDLVRQEMHRLQEAIITNFDMVIE